MAVTDEQLRRVRSLVLFAFGLCGLAFEMSRNGVERPTILIILAACAGLPTFLKLDESRSRQSTQSGEKD